jgi:hypothetical protein
VSFAASVVTPKKIKHNILIEYNKVHKILLKNTLRSRMEENEVFGRESNRFWARKCSLSVADDHGVCAEKSFTDWDHMHNSDTRNKSYDRFTNLCAKLTFSFELGWLHSNGICVKLTKQLRKDSHSNGECPVRTWRASTKIQPPLFGRADIFEVRFNSFKF